jgi:hypothetical protein
MGISTVELAVIIVASLGCHLYYWLSILSEGKLRASKRRMSYFDNIDYGLRFGL